MKPIHFMLCSLALIMTGTLYAQNKNLEKLSKKERNEELIAIAKQTVLTYGPGYYREYKKPVITAFITPEYSIKAKEDPKNIGRKVYIVVFLYDKTKETLEWDYAAKVAIWADTGEASDVYFGCNFGLRAVDMKAITRSGEVYQVPYVQSDVETLTN